MDGIIVSVSIFGDGFFLPSPAGEGGPLAVDEEFAFPRTKITFSQQTYKSYHSPAGSVAA